MAAQLNMKNRYRFPCKDSLSRLLSENVFQNQNRRFVQLLPGARLFPATEGEYDLEQQLWFDHLKLISKVAHGDVPSTITKHLGQQAKNAFQTKQNTDFMQICCHVAYIVGMGQRGVVPTRDVDDVLSKLMTAHGEEVHDRASKMMQFLQIICPFVDTNFEHMWASHNIGKTFSERKGSYFKSGLFSEKYLRDSNHHFLGKAETDGLYFPIFFAYDNISRRFRSRKDNQIDLREGRIKLGRGEKRWYDEYRDRYWTKGDPIPEDDYDSEEEEEDLYDF